MPFEIDDSVKVKEGVMCPDNDSVSMAGWQGRVFEIDDGIVGISWDSITLKQLPHEYIKQCEEKGLSWSGLCLSVDEIEPALPRDSEEIAWEVRKNIESTTLWLGDGEEGERILKVIADAEDEIEAWNDHLTQVLIFPFDAEVSDPQDRSPLKCGDHVQVKGFAEADDLYGVLVNVSRGRERFVFPLCDLTVLDKKSPNYRPVKDYCVWFANR